MVEGQGQREYCKKGSTGISQLYSAHTINRVPARVEGREGTEWQMVPKDMAWHGRYQQQEQQLPLCAAGTVPGLGWVPFGFSLGSAGLLRSRYRPTFPLSSLHEPKDF